MMDVQELPRERHKSMIYDAIKFKSIYRTSFAVFDTELHLLQLSILLLNFTIRYI